MTTSDVVQRAHTALEDPDNLDLALHPAPLVRALVAEVERLRAQIAAVRALHLEDDGECETCPDPFHPGTREPWPCPTTQALDREGTDADR